MQFPVLCQLAIPVVPIHCHPGYGCAAFLPLERLSKEQAAQAAHFQMLEEGT